MNSTRFWCGCMGNKIFFQGNIDKFVPESLFGKTYTFKIRISEMSHRNSTFCCSPLGILRVATTEGPVSFRSCHMHKHGFRKGSNHLLSLDSHMNCH